MDVDDIKQREELLAAFSQNPSVLIDAVSIHNDIKRRNLEEASNKAEIKAQRGRDINAMRKRWSSALLWSIVGIIIFDAIFSLLLGFGFLHFEDPRLILAFILENLIKIAGLAIVVVKFLFDPKFIAD